nr:aldo/keto reductase [Hyphomonas sp. Mor2]
MIETRVADLRSRLKGRLPLGFGVSGPLATRLYSARDVERLIDTARDQGVSIFDTAPSYGAGRGERRLGRSIGNDPAAFVMTKAGLTSGRWLDRQSDFAPVSIVQSVEASLRRLRRDRIDLLWLHGPGRKQINDPLKETLTELIDAGKVAAIGITSRDQPASELADAAPFSALMAPAHEQSSSLSGRPSNAILFGIECLKHVRSDRGFPRHRSHLWRATRTLLRKDQPIRGSISVDAAFGHAFETAGCDVVIMTTSKSSRIEQNRIICQRVVERRRNSHNQAQVDLVRALPESQGAVV